MIHLLVHYHMRPGGVSGVLRQQVRALRDLGHEVLLMTASGGMGTGVMEVGCPVIEVAGLDYARNPERCGESLWRAMRAAVGDFGDELIWHVHNPTLGCHAGWTGVLWRMAEAGERMILHLHDFAEDGRAENMAVLVGERRVYPVGERIRYVVLTRRDARALEVAGLPQEWCHVVSNPVEAGCAVEPRGGVPFVLYPTRGIDRKNVGEMCLLAALAPHGVRFATTLHPRESRQQRQYGWWQRCVEDLELPVNLGVVDERGGDLSSWVALATHVVSTSKQEGFGMVFVESVAWRRPMIGRAITHVDEDLRRLYGVAHPYLYDRLEDEEGWDFSCLETEDAVKLIAKVRDGKRNMRVVRGSANRGAQEWLAEALEHREALPLSCLEGFDGGVHGRRIAAIAAEVAGAMSGEVRYLDRQRVEDFFLRS